MHIAYLNHFLDDPAHYPHAEALFERFLAKSASSVEVFKVYLGYIRYVDIMSASPTLRSMNALIRRIKREREVVQQCYQFSLENAGQDKDSYEIWQEFINHLKAGEVRNVRQSAPPARFAPGTSFPLLSYPRSHRGCRWPCTMILRSLARSDSIT